jgi:trk system potassium uptake protein
MATAFLESKSGGGPPAIQRREVDLRLVPLAFITIILIGGLLLWTPWAQRSGQSIGMVDALFLSTSATCVTGLTTVNVAETFNTFGHVILLLLIQVGGLGIFTASILLVLLSGQKLSLVDENTIRATMGRLQHVRPMDVFIYGCVFMFVIELAGAVALFHGLSNALPEQSLGRTAWQALFHAVSAFCNAGITIYPEGVAPLRSRVEILGVLNLLVILGGIGLMVLINLRYFYFWRRDPRRRGKLTLQTKLTLIVSAALLGAGALVVLVFEQQHTLAAARGWDNLSWALFHSGMTRSGGFSVVDVGAMNPPTLLCSMALMFIGGSPGSMAGGIKVITFTILVLTAWSALRRRENIQVFGRHISPQLANVSVMMALLALGALTLGVGLLMLTESGAASVQTSQNWLGLMFEAVSAFGTVGLSTGVTPLLTTAGKIIILLLMFVGRVAPLMLSIYLARPPRPWHVRMPREDIGLG